MGKNIYQLVPPTFKCCFCCSAKTGGLIIGRLQMIYGSVLLVIGLFTIVTSLIAAHYDHISKSCSSVFIGIFFISLSGLLINGINKEKLILITYWLMCQTAVVIVDIIFSFIAIFVLYDYYAQSVSRATVIVSCAIGTGFDVYFLLIVSSYYSKRSIESDGGTENPEDALDRF